MLTWQCSPFDELSTKVLYAILKARQAVFVVEQNCPFLDADDVDQHCLHLLGWHLALVQNLPAYRTRAVQIDDFLVRDCWNGVRFLTGKSDPTIVTDVQALGTQVLGVGYSNGSFWVESYTKATQRYSGKKQVTGFDLNTDRDTVWTEGTLQQALAFWLAGDNARFGFYRTESEKLRQSSGAFWAASNRGTTGFGEFFERWQAVAPTAWYLFGSQLPVVPKGAPSSATSASATVRRSVTDGSK